MSGTCGIGPQMKELAKIREIFRTPRPAQFVDPTHCSECAEHNDILIKHSVDTISLEELGNPGWDPICFVGIEGYKYYLPALARLSTGTGDDYYLDQFLFHLNAERVEKLSAPEREALAEFLEALVESMPDEIESNLDSDGILSCIESLRTAA